MKKLLPIAGVSLLLPFFAHAQLDNTYDLVLAIMNIVELLLTLAAAVALLAFMWGLAKFIFKAADEGAQEEGRNLMKWGLIALFVMMSVWGIIRFFQDEFGLDNTPLDIVNITS